MKLNYKSKNRGLTLIEALIWFAIFSAVVAGVFSLYSSSRNASNASTVNKELSTIFSQMEQLFANDNTTGLSNAIGLPLGVFPKSLKSANTTGAVIKNIFGGLVTITGQPPSGFTVQYIAIPSGEVCSNILKSQKIVGWNNAEVDGTIVKYDNTYNIANVATACGENGMPSLTIRFIRL